MRAAYRQRLVAVGVMRHIQLAPVPVSSTSAAALLSPPSCQRRFATILSSVRRRRPSQQHIQLVTSTTASIDDVESGPRSFSFTTVSAMLNVNAFNTAATYAVGRVGADRIGSVSSMVAHTGNDFRSSPAAKLEQRR